MIDHIVKDAILSNLLKKAGDNLSISLNINKSMEDFGCNSAILEAVLQHFEDRGFIDATYMLGGAVYIRLKVTAYDFANHGGFTAQEELLEKNIKKLLLEVESLKPAFGDKVKLITDITSGIASGLTLFHTWNRS